METVGIFEAKTNLSQLLERVAAGEEITISKRGVPVAILSPAQAGKADKRKAAIEALKKIRKGRGMSADDIVKLIHEGRRY
jgi:prevent-host-death family protein